MNIKLNKIKQKIKALYFALFHIQHVSVYLTPDWYKAIQNLKDKGKLTDFEPDTEHNFYNFDLYKLTRKLILVMDNAPYHKGIEFQSFPMLTLET